MKQDEIRALMVAIAPVVRQFVEQQIEAAVQPLREKVVELAQRPKIVDRGVWREGCAYARGAAVSFGGSLWIAQKDYPSKPGDKDSGWRLAVKRGRDGKDATR